MGLASRDDLHAMCKDWLRRQQEYNGYTNHLTWLIANYIHNDQVSQQSWDCEADDALREYSYPDYQGETGPAARAALAETLEQVWNDDLDVRELQNTMPSIQGLAKMVMQVALGYVNWREIADELISKSIERAIDRMSAAYEGE